MKAFGFAVSVLVLFCLGYAWRDIQQGDMPDVRAFQSLVGVDHMAPKQSPEQQFKQAFSRIQTNYYRPVKSLELKYAGIGGMMASLGDPHTMFLVPQVAKSFDIETKANYVGVGARLSSYIVGGKSVGAKAVTVFDDGPGYAAGLRRGDIITAVDGKSIVGKSIEDVVDLIMGKEGTVVTLTLLKEGKAAPADLRVRRARVITPTVESTYFSQYQVGYLYIASFSSPTAEQFDRELDKVERHPLKGLVIDVRGNPGGYLDTATELLSRFKANKVVVSMRMRDGAVTKEYTTSGQVHRFAYPVVVLIDEESASAAEIFSGALRDYKMATLVGTHSYGKASVQEVYDFKDGSSGKITIARYFLPLGDDIGRKVDELGTYVSGGLEPDVKVEFQQQLPPELGGKQIDWESDLPNPEVDNQLKKAIEVVLSKAGI